MVASIRSSVLQGIKIGPAAAPPPPAPPEWWGDEGQTLEYFNYNGVYGGPILFYKKDVTRDMGGAGVVLTAVANTNSTPPIVNWLPTDADPQPIISISNLPTGEWTVSISNQSPVSFSGGGTLQILGPGTQILNIVIVWDTNNYWNLQFNQQGSA